MIQILMKQDALRRVIFVLQLILVDAVRRINVENTGRQNERQQLASSYIFL